MREFKRHRGYITIAQQSGGVDYLRMAYALALSLRATQSTVPYLTVAVLPNTEVPKKYADVFDEVVEIPWGDDAAQEEWKIHNKWKVYHITPYEETVLLDSDMLFTTDVSQWWDWMSLRNMWATTIPRTYKGEHVDSHYRELFTRNSLPMVYSAFMYFRQHEDVHAVFDSARRLIYHWSSLRNYYQYRQTSLADIDIYKTNLRFRYGWQHPYKSYPSKVSGDLMFAMAMMANGFETEYAPSSDLPTFVHMKDHEYNWTKELPWSLKDDLTLTVNNHVQRYPFHYCLKDFLNDDIIRKLERAWLLRVLRNAR